MYVNAHIQVIINGATLTSVVSVDMHNDGNHIGASCDLVVPLNARIKQYDESQAIVPSRVHFNTGDHIVINAKYDGYEKFGDTGEWARIFEGFLYDFSESTPIKIKCIDYIYWFNLGIYGANYVYTKKSVGHPAKGGTGKGFDKIEFADLLQDLIDWTNESIQGANDENGTSIPKITLIKPEFSFQLVNVAFPNMSPAAVLEYLKRELGFNISLTGNQLYANVASFTVNSVNLSTDKNVIHSDLQSTNLTKLKNKGSNSIFLRIKLKAYFEKEDGTKDSFELGDPNGQLREVFFYKVAKGNQVMKDGQLVYDNYHKLANEALNKAYQNRYTGTVETYLYPVCGLFWKVNYTDVQYPDRNGNYVITSENITINDNGYHRHLKLAYLTDLNMINGQ
jgi:hypothetical protein